MVKKLVSKEKILNSYVKRVERAHYFDLPFIHFEFNRHQQSLLNLVIKKIYSEISNLKDYRIFRTKDSYGEDDKFVLIIPLKPIANDAWISIKNAIERDPYDERLSYSRFSNISIQLIYLFLEIAILLPISNVLLKTNFAIGLQIVVLCLCGCTYYIACRYTSWRNYHFFLKWFNRYLRKGSELI